MLYITSVVIKERSGLCEIACSFGPLQTHIDKTCIKLDNMAKDYIAICFFDIDRCYHNIYLITIIMLVFLFKSVRLRTES